MRPSIVILPTFEQLASVPENDPAMNEVCSKIRHIINLYHDGELDGKTARYRMIKALCEWKPDPNMMLTGGADGKKAGRRQEENSRE